MSKSRLKNSARNVISGCLGYLLGLLLAFISKHQFIRILGSEFNGLNGLFSNILNILNIVELGFGSALVFILYLPLRNGDTDEISRIISFLKKIYVIISFSIFCFGLISLSFLKYLIHEDISKLPFSLYELYLFYLLFLINNSFSYLLSHKKILLIADQKNYHVTNVDNGTTIVMHVLQIAMLIAMEKNSVVFGSKYKFASYMIFLSLLISKTLIRNIIIMIIANKTYPFLKVKLNSKLEKTKKVFIFKKVKSMTFHKASEAVLNGATTIVISAFIGIRETGKYGNYMMIVMNLITLVNIFYGALLASVGNLSVTSNIEKQYDIFKKIHFLTKFIAFFVFVSLYVLLNDFIKIWIKSEDSRFNENTLLAICIFAYISIIRKTVVTFRDAKGLFSKDTFKAIFEVIIGIPITIVFALEFSVAGAVLGYCFTSIVVSIPAETKTLFGFGFKKAPYKYYFSICKNFIFTLLLGMGMSEIFKHIPTIPKGNFVVKTFVTLFFILSIFFVVNFKTQEFKYGVGLIKRFIGRKKHVKGQLK